MIINVSVCVEATYNAILPVVMIRSRGVAMQIRNRIAIPGIDVKSMFCFAIVPEMKRRGIARRFLRSAAGIDKKGFA
jgi:hypothetical protein